MLDEFEEKQSELKRLTERLESGELTLEESLETYERGVTLARELRQILDDAMCRVEIVNPDGSITIFTSDRPTKSSR